MHLGLIEMLFFFGAVLAWALWELWSVRPGRKPDRKPGDADDPEENSGS
jgi:hypothetical protein